MSISASTISSVIEKFQTINFQTLAQIMHAPINHIDLEIRVAECISAGSIVGYRIDGEWLIKTRSTGNDEKFFRENLLSKINVLATGTSL